MNHRTKIFRIGLLVLLVAAALGALLARKVPLVTPQPQPQATNTPQHGAMEMPIARQFMCFQAGGYYWPYDGSGIRDAGCRAAYQHVYGKFQDDPQQAAYQFEQWHEVSTTVEDYNNPEAVKAAIPDGTLCSAGNVVDRQQIPELQQMISDFINTLHGRSVGIEVNVNDKSGLDQPANWTVQTLTKDRENKVTMTYRIAVPHSPAFWEIYVSRAGYDPTRQPLTWADLEAPQRLDEVPAVDGKYELKVDLGQHSGRRIIYSRWQRVDAAGEGFYNCSDVNIVAGS
ncbi:lytic polysaccharide monooxygenase [Pseudomonas putida]|uniref:lytic polysaccharide monooxygenase n=1 Tax=Pseudomonas putida TaxID=303 RepID=UPI00383A5273